MGLKNFSTALISLVGLLFIGCSLPGNGNNPPPPKPKAQKVQIVDTQKRVDPVDEQLEIKRKELGFLNSNPIKEPIKEFSVVGEGIAPKNTISPAQALVLAKRAAVADAYRQLGEKLYGVKVNSKETVKDAALKNSKIITQVNGLIKDAYITETSYKNGIYRVKMELKIDSKTWKRIFSY